MSNFIVVRDSHLCTQCMACVAKCKKVNRFGARVRLPECSAAMPLRQDMRQLTIMSCHHCEIPLCLEACPSGALQRSENGVVMVSVEDCLGCSACVDACPWHIPVVPDAGQSMVKCNLCGGRAALGELPECVKICPSDALRLVRIEDLCLEGRAEYAQKFLLRNF